MGVPVKGLKKDENTYQLNENTLERIYAGWLGKVIGIRMGAPVEGWSSEEIQKKYGELWDYPVDYGNFAADDDSNGPVFLVRALEQVEPGRKLTAQDVAEALLNYAPYEHGFFWWGGYGLSTEHTAYLNLRQGILAPLSGSIQKNGKTVAEQIGGQIFIDPWGLVSPGNPGQAAELAREAASVTHDGNGIWGGVFVAVCISLAFEEWPMEELIEKALTYLPSDCAYAEMVREVLKFWEKDKTGDWRVCLAFIQEHFGYDKYPGSCHIIPNAAVMILALLYGGDDFARTLCICNMCGWDTDCNVGNLGSIMGVRAGISGIDYEKWQRAVNDLLICSGTMGSLNIMDVPYGASCMARQAFALAGVELPGSWKELLENHLESCHFEYPGSTHAMRVRLEQAEEDENGDREYTAGEGCRQEALYRIYNTSEMSCTGRRSLKVEAEGMRAGAKLYVYQKTYYRAEDLYDNRYEPSFSPRIYPGQYLRAKVLACGIQGYVQLYVWDLNDGELLSGKKIPCQKESWLDLEFVIPFKRGACLGEAGLLFTAQEEGSGGLFTAYLDILEYGGEPDYEMDFRQERLESWCEHWSSTQREITQFTRVKGSTWLEDEWLHVSGTDFAETYTGSHTFGDYCLSAELKPLCGEKHLLNVRVQGAVRSYAAGFYGEGKLGLLKNKNGYQILAETEFFWETGKCYRIEVQCRGAVLWVLVDGKRLLEYEDCDGPYLQGAVGMSVFEGSHCAYRNLRAEGAHYQARSEQ